MNQKVCIVIPTYNEKHNIVPLIEKILSLPLMLDYVIVVDDASPDGTAEKVKECIKKDTRVHLVLREGKQGLGSAYIRGFQEALGRGAERVIQMDADFSHDPQDIPHLLEASQTVDVVIGSRKIQGGRIIGWGWIRRVMSASAMWFARQLLGIKTHDVTSGFRCYHRKVFQAIRLETIKSNGYAFQEEMLFRSERMGFSIKEIPVTFLDRQNGKSKLSKKDIMEFFVVMWRLRREVK